MVERIRVYIIEFYQKLDIFFLRVHISTKDVCNSHPPMD